jgi:phospholipid/cholesterol/gamma-HCH transport system substrate-binding protein
MAKNRTNEIKVGLVSIIAIALLVIGISVGTSYNVSGAKQIIKMRFPNSSGIQIKSPVHINGVKRGAIDKVENSKGSVLIFATLDRIDDLKEDVSARISMQELTGGRKIDIYPGNSSIPFSPEKEIIGTTAADLAEIVAMLGNIGINASNLINRLDTVSMALTELLADGKVISQLKNTALISEQIVSNLNNLLNNNIDNINQSIKDLRNITNSSKNFLAKYEPKIESLLNNLDKTIIESKNLVSYADFTIKGADKLIDNVNSLVQDIKQGKGLVTEIIYNENLAKKLDSTIVKLSEFIELIRQYGVNVNLRLGTRP